MNNDTEIFKKILTRFVMEEDPPPSMLNRTPGQMMQKEPEQKLHAKKHEHSIERKGYLSGYRPRCFDTHMGTIYLLAPKVRKGGYIPFLLPSASVANRHCHR